MHKLSKYLLHVNTRFIEAVKCSFLMHLERKVQHIMRDLTIRETHLKTYYGRLSEEDLICTLEFMMVVKFLLSNLSSI